MVASIALPDDGAEQGATEGRRTGGGRITEEATPERFLSTILRH
ncbi:hypothetical protein [Streptomyces humicola]|nr:hypothetical protein [Streptomyces humicola]